MEVTQTCLGLHDQVVSLILNTKHHKHRFAAVKVDTDCLLTVLFFLGWIKPEFSWGEYLTYCNAKAAPDKCFNLVRNSQNSILMHIQYV